MTPIISSLFPSLFGLLVCIKFTLSDFVEEVWISPSTTLKAFTEFSNDYQSEDLFQNDTMEFLRRGRIDLTKTRWSHAVNCKKLLKQSLNDENVDMLEADILIGNLDCDPDGLLLPIMAHAPNNISDLSLNMFLHDVMKYNKRHKSNAKGIKLDFKSIEAFEEAMPTLRALIPLMNFPVWLNADILEGPVNCTSVTPVDATRFFKGCSEFKDAVLSIGWTTNWSCISRTGSYSAKYIDAMIRTLHENEITRTGQAITFPIRAGIAANNKEELIRLLKTIKTTNNCTFTIWSAPNDYVNVVKLRRIIDDIGKDCIYLDVPSDLEVRLFQKYDDNNDWSTFLAIAAALMVFFVGYYVLRHGA